MKILKLFLILLIANSICYAQNSNHQPYSQLKEKQAKYQAVLQLNSGDDKVIQGVLRNINNVLADSKLKGQIEIELVVFGNGIVLFMKDHPYEKQLLALKEKGVILAQCLNTMKAKNISKEQLFPFISYVESGIGELILKQKEGWVYIHP
ncbi:MAG: DsrE family protein [Sphingobacteriales bacterium]|nr:DsrE family protein [Sphingobacteriales bacterium]